MYGLSEGRHDQGQYINQKIEEQKVLNKVPNHVYVNNNSLKFSEDEHSKLSLGLEIVANESLLQKIDQGQLVAKVNVHFGLCF